MYFVYKINNQLKNYKDLIYNGKLYTMESVGNCPMCKGAGKVTVERLGLKECPKCDGSGDIQGEQEQPPMIQQEPPMLQGGESCNCQKKTKDEIAYESFISKKIEILKKWKQSLVGLRKQALKQEVPF